MVVTDSPTGRLAQEIRAGRHVLVADEPAGVGDDLGPTPYDLLLASLGACTAMTLRLYADRKGWPLEHVSVQLTHDRVHADDSRDCEKRRAGSSGSSGSCVSPGRSTTSNASASSRSPSDARSTAHSWARNGSSHGSTTSDQRFLRETANGRRSDSQRCDFAGIDADQNAVTATATATRMRTGPIRRAAIPSRGGRSGPIAEPGAVAWMSVSG